MSRTIHSTISDKKGKLGELLLPLIFTLSSAPLFAGPPPPLTAVTVLNCMVNHDMLVKSYNSSSSGVDGAPYETSSWIPRLASPSGASPSSTTVHCSNIDCFVTVQTNVPWIGEVGTFRASSQTVAMQVSPGVRGSYQGLWFGANSGQCNCGPGNPLGPCISDPPPPPEAQGCC